MNRLLLSLLLTVVILLSNSYYVAAQGPTKQWDKRFGGSNDDFLSDIQQTSDGGYILAGDSYSGISGDKSEVGRGIDDYWVVKLDASGTKQWDKTLGGSDTEELHVVLQTSDGGYLLGGWSLSGRSGDKTEVGRGRTDYWVVKLDASGTKQWDKRFGGLDHDNLYTMQQTSDGGYLLGGYSDSGVGGDKTQTNLVSQFSAEYWVVKIDATGTKQWDKAFGSDRHSFLWSLQQTSDGGYLLGGYSISPISGDKTQANQGGNDFWVIKLSATPLTTVAAAARPALSAYPNPTSTQLTLSGPLGTPYQLLNQVGQVVRSGQLSAQPLDVQALPAGLYIVRDQTSGRSTKLVKE